MKNQAEIYKALLDGKVLSLRKTTMRSKLIDGVLITDNGNGKWDADNYFFNSFENWEIEQKWYEKDISNGVLCRVTDRPTNGWLSDIIFMFDKSDITNHKYFKGHYRDWYHAEPLDLSKPLLPQLENK